jgi:hypothetical protein
MSRIRILLDKKNSKRFRKSHTTIGKQNRNPRLRETEQKPPKHFFVKYWSPWKRWGGGIGAFQYF